MLTYKHQHDAAIAAFQRAIDLNPNFTDWPFAIVLVYAGEAARAIEVAKSHMRLDPFHPPAALGFLGFAYYMLKRFNEGICRCFANAPTGRRRGCPRPGSARYRGALRRGQEWGWTVISMKDDWKEIFAGSIGRAIK